jgi:hypothetical protein
LAKQVFREPKIIYEVSSTALSPDMPADATFEEYLSDELHNYGADILLKEMDTPSQEQIEQLVLLLSEKAARYSIRIIQLHGEDYETINTLEPYGKYRYPRIFLHYVEVHKNANGDVTITWRDWVNI